MDSPKNKTRVWELDFLRGIALILMIYFHILYDMGEFFSYKINCFEGYNYYIGRISVILFILISGISSTLSRSNLKRGFKLLLVALCVSLFSYLYDKNFVIKFGVIHFFASCMLLYPLIDRINKWVLPFLGTAIIALGPFFGGLRVSNEYLFPFGVTTPSFTSSDYYSLVPWMGLFLYGIFLGKTVYSGRKSILKFQIPKNPVNSIGKHTLLFYIIHQPLIIGVLSLIKLLYNFSL